MPAGGNQFYSTSAITTTYKAKIVFLPCSKYNLSQIGEGEVNEFKASVLYIAS